ncbi:MAG: hypothetical protein DI629_12225 [Mesorhizobium amorphae]|nr:MAG: hypothetical protein DI629_12225 [Mesorhizobium amorphae]
MGEKLTPEDKRVLAALGCFTSARSYEVAHRAGIRTMSIRETGARHLIRLTKAGLAIQVGTRMSPQWQITEAGRATLSEDRSNG